MNRLVKKLIALSLLVISSFLFRWPIFTPKAVLAESVTVTILADDAAVIGALIKQVEALLAIVDLLRQQLALLLVAPMISVESFSLPENNISGRLSPLPVSTPLPSLSGLSLPPSIIDFVGFSLPPAAPRSTNVFIDKIFPARGAPGTVIVINGRGFSVQNKLYTGFGVFDASSSDGKTISFALPLDILEIEQGSISSSEFLEADNFFESDLGVPSQPLPPTGPVIVPLWLYIESGQGFSNEAIFDLEWL
jgi:hypothetical protein